jgi:hypothetical protein
MAQLKIFRKMVAIRYSPDLTTFHATTTELIDLNTTFWTAAAIDKSFFLLAGMITALSHNHPALVDGILARYRSISPHLKESFEIKAICSG